MSQILVVDDDPVLLSALTDMLHVEQLRAAGASDCATAEAMVASHFFPVILADLRLRSEDEGLRLLASIRKLSPRSRVATMTRNSTPEIEERVRELGAQLVLQKPIDVEALVAVLREMVAEVESAATVDDLEEVYRASAGALQRISRGRYRFPAEDAEELIQETWCLFLEKRRSIREPRAWLSGTIANLCRQEIERRTRDRARSAAMPELPVEVANDEVLAVRQALERLDPRSRALCEMIGMERRSYEEVSAAAGIPLGSVGPLFIRAKEKMRRAISA